MELITPPLAVLFVWFWALLSNPQFLQQFFLNVYVVLLGTVTLYGFHRYLLIFIYYRHRRKYPKPLNHFQKLPTVTVQLPMFNERHVVQRVIEAACAIEYPRDKLQIQILDDSTDDTSDIILACVCRLARAGHNISYLHRPDRQGFKAGNLAAALPHASGEFVAIFDADFLPEPDFLRRTIQYFTDPKVGLVQTRWGHINRDSSLLTKVQAMMLDGHFIIEHIARNRSGRFMSFNGTAGIWRKKCIEDAGGWHCDTLTEDLDLSYRAQLRGWNFIYLPEVISPAELPPDMNSFKVQQFRWTKGAVQVAKKMLPAVLLAPLPFKVKLEAFFQLTNWILYPCMVLLSLLLFPIFLIKLNLFASGAPNHILFDLAVFNLGTTSVVIFYLYAQREVHGSWLDKVKFLPVLMSIGIGLGLSNVKAVFEGLIGKKNEFVSTPKFGLSSPHDISWKTMTTRTSRKFQLLPFVELLFGTYLFACIVVSLVRYRQITISLPFLGLFMGGYFYVGIATLRSLYAAPVAQLPTPKPIPHTVNLPTGPLPIAMNISPDSSPQTPSQPAQQKH